METEKKNYYEVLEIPVSASPQEIEKSYVRARNAYSGDSVALYSLMTAQECNQVLEQIEEAYAVLGFPEKRREYDRVRGFNQNGIQRFAGSMQPQERPMPRMDSTPSLSTPTATDKGFGYEDFSTNTQEAKVSKVQALKKFGLDYEADPAMEQKIEQAKDFTGPWLKEIREYKGVTMERMVEMTRISRTHITTIEADDVSKMPADAYVRGFVSQYAKVLKLNPELVATSYLHHVKRLKGAK